MVLSFELKSFSGGCDEEQGQAYVCSGNFQKFPDSRFGDLEKCRFSPFFSHTFPEFPESRRKPRFFPGENTLRLDLIVCTQIYVRVDQILNTTTFFDSKFDDLFLDVTTQQYSRLFFDEENFKCKDESDSKSNMHLGKTIPLEVFSR